MTEPATAPQFVILSGLSGAGKTQALDVFEDAGFFCIDNLPPELVPTLVDLLRREGSKVHRVAVVCDARGGEYFGQLGAMLEKLRERAVDYRLVFLEASNETLVRRFKETRRRHPLGGDSSVLDAIRAERRLLSGLREQANLIIDTADLSIPQLRAMLNDELISEGRQAAMVVAFVSFGYKFGIPIDADLLFDVRFLPNPYWEQELRPLTGLEAPVREYVLMSAGSDEYFAHLLPLLDFLLPRYAAEGKAHLTVGIGCTGGKHRSVTIAEYLVEQYRRKGFYAIVRHRDLARD
jgi:UPF0042 nucleotide-binding protein